MTSIITTFRGVDRNRIENLYAVENYYAGNCPEWEMIIVEQDTQSSLNPEKFNGHPNHLLVEYSGPFNKSWGMNIGFRQAQSDVLVICDSDMLVTREDIYRAVEACRTELDVVRPFRRLIDLDRAETAIFLASGELRSTAPNDQGFDRNYAGETLCLAGGIFAIRKEFYAQTGGFDERFEGWGGEDDAFSIQAQRLTSRTAIARESLAWHLWHPRYGPSDDAGYRRNCEMLDEYRSADLETTLSRLEGRSPDIGLLDKYSGRS